MGNAFRTNDSALFRYHTDQENLLQMIYMILAGYFEDDDSTLLDAYGKQEGCLKLLKIAATVP